MWELAHNRPQHPKAQQAKADKAARKQGAAAAAASAETQAHIHPTEEGENSDEEPIVPRGPEWVDSMYEDRAPALIGIVIEAAWSAIFPILTLLEIHHRFGYVHLRWITHPYYHGQSQQSRSSRHSSGRARTGSDSTTIRGKPTPASEIDLLQQPPGRPEML